MVGNPTPLPRKKTQEKRKKKTQKQKLVEVCKIHKEKTNECKLFHFLSFFPLFSLSLL